MTRTIERYSKLQTFKNGNHGIQEKEALPSGLNWNFGTLWYVWDPIKRE